MIVKCGREAIVSGMSLSGTSTFWGSWKIESNQESNEESIHNSDTLNLSKRI
jgi:hypothetical protein